MSEEKLKVPHFDGYYEHWSEMMENLLRAKRLWNLIEPGFEEPAVGVALNEGQKKKLEEIRIKDQQVKHYLYQAIDRVTFEQILDRRTAKTIWDSMKKRFEGNERVKKSLLQKLRRDFEVLEMKSNETVTEYFARVLTISNQMRSNGESMPDVKIVEKILRTLTEKYMFVVKFKKPDKEEEQALKVNYEEGLSARGRGRSSFRGRGRGRGRQSFNRATTECYKCHKLGHFQYECPGWKEANYAELDEEDEMMLMAKIGEAEKDNVWFLDSGCSNHMCGDKGKFTSLDLGFSHSVKLGNNTRMDVGGKGQVKLILNGDVYVINEVYYVPELKNNLLSMGQLQEKGLSILIQDDMCKIYHPQKGLLIQCPMSANRMFALFDQTQAEGIRRMEGCLYSNSEDLSRLWHERYGHLSKAGMEMLQRKKMVRGMPEFKVSNNMCTDCLVGKQDRNSIPKQSTWRAKDILELIHSDICGPISPTSNSGKRYILCFIDDYSRKAWIYLLVEKSEAFVCFKNFKKKVEKETGKSIKALRTDRGGEFTSDSFRDFCREHGISRQLTTAYTPQQNGVAERRNRTVMNMVRSMLAAKKMPRVFWAEAAVWTFYILNRCPTKALMDVTPQEAWCGTKPSVEHFKVWGSIAHVHVPGEKRSKLDDKSVTCILVGLSEESKGYRLLNPQTKKIITSKDVRFEEDKLWEWGADQGKKNEPEMTWGDDEQQEENVVDEDICDDEEVYEDDNHGETEESRAVGVESSGAREGRPRRTPRYLSDYVTGNEPLEEDELNMVEIYNQDPTTYEEAVKSKKWRVAMDAEIEAIERNLTWELAVLPIDTKCIGVKWIFKTKLNERGEVVKYKARLVAKGYSQEHGVDYMEVYAPVARMDTIRMVIALAAQKGWSIFQMDVKSAFLYGTLQEDVYIQQPQGYVVKGSEHKVYKLRKALYGLKQAPRAWFSRIETYFIKEGFEKSKNEQTLFIKKNSKGNILIISIYVDDLIYTGDDVVMMQEFKESMQKEFEMSDLGKMRFFLGIEVLQTAQGIHISQQKYAIEILRRFDMEDCNAVINPIVPGCKLKSDEGERFDETLFKQIVGSLMYITTTRPDIQFVVNLISRFMAKPTEVHYLAAKRVLRYLKGTTDFGIWYKSGGEGSLEVFTDSDFAGDIDSRKSTSGYVFLWNNGAITWSSKKQDIVALSSTEAEYVAAAICACQVIWVRGVLEELGLEINKSTVIKCDNTSTIKLSKNPVFHGRCKHIGVRFHFLRDLVKDEVVQLEHCGSSEQVADILTKPLNREVFLKLREKLGVCSIEGKLAEGSQSSLREGMKE
ncbi:hypothetical protein OSB04_013828 [Centaurea solstitialis]|uniref:Uncharacterized protein n=1 Tax=Centaurea solstitialis TaxID=347529 RepID=A0AA38TE09_9ASTR|nr:hypothetical protein OSB04_013828 [Centaurea solstitialis]